jgi:hypothetical protein
MKSTLGFALVCVLLLALAGCSLPGMPAATPSLPSLPPASTKALPVNTLPPLPTFTKSASTPLVVTTTLLPSLPAPTLGAGTAAPTKPAAALPTSTLAAATKAPAATNVPATATPALSAKEARIFMIAINDNGGSGKKIGCNDSAVPVTFTLPDPAAPLRGALDKLLSVRTRYYGQSGLYNSLFQSDLRLDSVTIVSGVAEIRLSGALTLGGTCDSPRVWAQFEETALQFSTVKSVNILVNGKKLQDLLSSK